MSMPHTASVVELIDGLLCRAAAARASDVHFEPTDAHVLVRFRIDGRLCDIERLPVALLPNVVTRLKVLAGLLSYRLDIPQEGGLTLPSSNGAPSLDLRISTFPTIRGERVAVRLLPRTTDPRGLEELGLSPAAQRTLRDAIADLQGLVLVTGPAGSGKTTTLYALLRQLQATRPDACLMTVEDPVEHRLNGVAQIQVAPHGELNYARALRSLMRHDPQAILIGEIRDAETAAIAVEAALTGHLILSSMHSGTAVEAVVRLREMGVPAYAVTSTLRLVVCQRLLRKRCAACAAEPGGDQRKANPIGEARATPPQTACGACMGTGYMGRTACSEFAVMDSGFRAAILAGGDSERLQSVMAQQPGFVRLRDDAERHVRAGTTTRHDADMILTRTA